MLKSYLTQAVKQRNMFNLSGHLKLKKYFLYLTHAELNFF